MDQRLLSEALRPTVNIIVNTGIKVAVRVTLRSATVFETLVANFGKNKENRSFIQMLIYYSNDTFYTMLWNG